MSEQNSVVAVYKTHAEAEDAVKQLQRAGTDMHRLSVVGKDTHADEQVVGYYNAGDRMKYWEKLERSGRILGIAVWICIFRHSRHRSYTGCRSGGCVDRRSTRRRGSGGWT